MKIVATPTKNTFSPGTIPITFYHENIDLARASGFGYKTCNIDEDWAPWSDVNKITFLDKTFVLQENTEEIKELQRLIDYYRKLNELI